GELSRIRVVATERTVLAQPRRTEEDDGLLNPFAPKRLKRLQIFGEDAQRSAVVAVEKRFVVVRKNRIRTSRAHDAYCRVTKNAREAVHYRPDGQAEHAFTCRFHPNAGSDLMAQRCLDTRKDLDAYPIRDTRRSRRMGAHALEALS